MVPSAYGPLYCSLAGRDSSLYYLRPFVHGTREALMELRRLWNARSANETPQALELRAALMERPQALERPQRY